MFKFQTRAGSLIGTLGGVFLAHVFKLRDKVLEEKNNFFL